MARSSFDHLRGRLRLAWLALAAVGLLPCSLLAQQPVTVTGKVTSESGEPLSRPVAERAKMVRVMKTAASLLETAENTTTRRMAENLVAQLCDVMPELKEVSPWHTVGQRRSLEEMGRAAEQVIDDRGMFGHEAYE